MEISSTDVQNSFGTYLKFLLFEDVVVTKNGKRIAVIKHYEDETTTASAVSEKAAAYAGETAKITYEDFMKLSEESENRYEFIDGEVYLLASPSFDHQKIIVELLNVMYQWFKGKKCRPLTSPFDVTLQKEDYKNVVQPDIVVICDEENVNEKGRYFGTPSLVVEVLSESTQRKDMLKKLNLYIYSGVKEYWIVNPFNKEIYIYYYADCDIKDYKVYKGFDTAQSIAFPGLGANLVEVFHT
jgi:Uma2 family endonuclease